QGRPRHPPGLPEHGVGPVFATAVGLLIFSQRHAEELMQRTQPQYLATGTGYLARVGQWIRESF
ncbi:MAG: cell division protein FtsA, partial [Hyphomicrobiales bacterium]|nr:cell division protein FtsA [Hyphomicrobiales bacterium]